MFGQKIARLMVQQIEECLKQDTPKLRQQWVSGKLSGEMGWIVTEQGKDAALAAAVAEEHF